jgi:hypothetical protein
MFNVAENGTALPAWAFEKVRLSFFAHNHLIAEFHLLNK